MRLNCTTSYVCAGQRGGMPSGFLIDSESVMMRQPQTGRAVASGGRVLAHSVAAHPTRNLCGLVHAATRTNSGGRDHQIFESVSACWIVIFVRLAFVIYFTA